MFLSTLNSEQKQAFLSLAHQFISADGQLASQEQAMLRAMKLEMELPEDVEFSDSNFSNLAQVFDSKKSRVSVLLEIIGLGYSDNDFHPEEDQIVKKLAEELSFSEDDVP